MNKLLFPAVSFSSFQFCVEWSLQIHGNSVEGRILHGNSPCELIERFTETIGRQPELPEWIISGALVGMQGGTDVVRHIWDQLTTYDVPISAFWLQVIPLSLSTTLQRKKVKYTQYKIKIIFY